MAVTSHNEVHDGRRMSIGAKGVRRYTRTWRVITDDPYTEQLVIALDGRTPRRGDVYAAGSTLDLAATVTDVRIEQQDDRLEWLVTADYDSTPKPTDPNPLNRPADISWEFNQYQKPIDKDINDTPILNAAKDPFDPVPEIDDMRLALKVVKNLPNYDVNTAFDYTNAINSDVWMGGDVETWKCREITTPPIITEEYEVAGVTQTVQYYRITFIFDYRRETWKLKVLNAGYRAYFASTTDKRTVTDGVNNQVNFPWPLSSGGTAIASNSTGWNYLEFDVYRKLPFSVLPIP